MREIPIIAPIPKNGYWILTDDVKISVDYGNRRYTYFIPKGFETDFASVPRFLWWLIAPTDYPLLRASLLHDYLYRTGTRASRKWADRVLVKIAIEDGLPKWKACLMYSAVRLFGQRVWNKYREGEGDKESERA